MFYIMDIYNNKIKWVDVKIGDIEMIVGIGELGVFDVDGMFDELVGFLFVGDFFYIVDMNNYVICKFFFIDGLVLILVIDDLIFFLIFFELIC